MQVGDIITITHGTYERAGTNTYPAHLRVESGEQLRITRVNSERIIARGGIWSGGDASIWVERYNIQTVNGISPVTGTVPRRPGTKPEDTDNLVHIDIHDPGIQWLFEDMAAFAEGKSWCSQYDDLARTLGIPGRPRNYDASVTRGDTTIRARITAHSQEQADAALAAMLIPAE